MSAIQCCAISHKKYRLGTTLYNGKTVNIYVAHIKRTSVIWMLTFPLYIWLNFTKNDFTKTKTKVA